MNDGFSLWEALLWEPPDGYFLLEHHVHRLQRSAAHFKFVLDVHAVRENLWDYARTLPPQRQKVRLELAADGSIVLNSAAVRPSTPVAVALAREPVRSDDEWLRHKTSRRSVYDRALAAHPEAQDVLFWNERGELTETCHGNVVLRIGAQMLTPPLHSGLLPGTFRRHLLDSGEIEEAILHVDSIGSATSMFLINSVRRWCDIALINRAGPR